MSGPQTPSPGPPYPTGPQGPTPASPYGSSPPYGSPPYGGAPYGGAPYGGAPQGGPGYGSGPYAGPGYGAPGFGPPGPPKATSTTGPKITLTVGIVLFVAAVVAAVMAGRAILDVLPTDVLRLDGSQGPGVVGAVDAPGAGEVALLGDRTYSLYLVTDQYRDTDLAGSLTVASLDGAALPVGTHGMNSYLQLGSARAELVGSVEVDVADVYAIEAPDTADGLGGQIYVAEGDAVGGMVGGMLGGVFGTLAAVALGVIGFALILTGGIMWGVRRGNARRAGLG